MSNGRRKLDVYDLETGDELQVGLADIEQLAQPKVGAVLRPERLRVSTTLVRDKKTGHIFVDVFKRHAKPYWLTTEPRKITLDNTAPNLSINPLIPMPIDRQGAVEIDYSLAKSDGDFTILIFDPHNRPLLMNREIHIRTIAGGFGDLALAGAAGRPLVWPEPWFLSVEENKRNFMVSFRDLSGLPQNNIQFVLHGRRFYHQNAPQSVVERYEDYRKGRPLTMPFFWTTDQFVKIEAGLPVGTERDFDIRITDEADTIWWKLTAVSQNNVPFEFMILEKANTRPLMTDFVRFENGFGTAEFPFIFHEPTYWEAGTKLIFRIRTLTQDELIVWPTFIAQKIYRARLQRRLGVR